MWILLQLSQWTSMVVMVISAKTTAITIAGILDSPNLKIKIGHIILPGQLAYRQAHPASTTIIATQSTNTTTASIKNTSYNSLVDAQLLYLLQPSMVKYRIAVTRAKLMKNVIQCTAWLGLIYDLNITTSRLKIIRAQLIYVVLRMYCYWHEYPSRAIAQYAIPIWKPSWRNLRAVLTVFVSRLRNIFIQISQNQQILYINLIMRRIPRSQHSLHKYQLYSARSHKYLNFQRGHRDFYSFQEEIEVIYIQLKFLFCLNVPRAQYNQILLYLQHLYLSALLGMIRENNVALSYEDKNEMFYRPAKTTGLLRKTEKEIQNIKLEPMSFHYPYDSQKPLKYKPLDQNFQLWAFVNEFRISNLEKKQAKAKQQLKRTSFSPCQNLRNKYMKRRPSLTLMKQSQELSFENIYKDVKTARNEESFRETSQSFHIKRKRTLKKRKNTHSTVSSCPAEEELGQNTKKLIQQLNTYEIKFQSQNPSRVNNGSRRAKYQ